MKNKISILVSMLILASGCSTYSENDLKLFDEKIQSFIASNDLEYSKSESGLYFKIIEEGEGDNYIKYNDQVTFCYRGKFLDGNVFQEINENNPITFKLRELIIGWQESISLLKTKGQINVIIPPQLGYGNKQTELIPPNTILVYEIKILEVI